VRFGSLSLDAGDLDELARILVPYIVQAMEDEGDWYSTTEFAAKGYAPSVEAATKRARRLLNKGSDDARKMGSRLYLRGPSKW
jgi:hypothetical protein